MGEKRTRTKFWCQNSQPYPNLPLVPPLSYSLAIHSPAENQEWQRIPGRTAPASAAPDIHVARRAGPQSRVPGAVRAVKPMVRRRTLDPVSIFDRQGVLSLFRQKGIKERHAETVWSYLGKHRERDVPLSEVPDVPASVRQLFAAAQIVKFTTRVVQARYSDDGEVVKLLIQLQTGEQVEAVIMRYDPSLGSDPSQPDGKRLGKARATLCLSSQVGCSMGCTFCATGTMGLKSSLLPAEMVEQMAHACLYSTTPVRNIVFMGMGEPLDAYDEVCEAIRMLTKQTLFGVSHKHLTVSTVGVIPRIRQLAHDLPAVRLALSLHAPSQPLRQQIVPTAKAWDLDRLLAAVREWQDATGQGVFVEYVLLHGVNDALSQARELADLLTSNGIRATVNLIPWNPVLADEGIVFEAPGEEHSLAFRAVLSEAGIRCTIRREKGQSMAAACGQLAITSQRPRDADRAPVADIEDLHRGRCAGPEVGTRGGAGSAAAS